MTSIVNQIAILLGSNGFNPSYAYLNNKYENRLNAQFATINIISNKAIGKAVSSDGSVFEEYELEVKISMYFKPSENVITVQTLSDNMLQRFYHSNNINITNIFLKPVYYSSTYKCLQREMILKLSYLLEEAS